jgi:hypothetical protein
MGTKILDAGGKLMLTSELRAEVEASLEEYLHRGAKLISVTQKLGSTWVAACTLPPKLTAADATDTLSFDEHAQGAHLGSADAPEFDDHCRVEELGFKRIITGPSRAAVELRIEHLKQFGAELVADPEQLGDSWTAVVDTGGADKSYRW